MFSFGVSHPQYCFILWPPPLHFLRSENINLEGKNIQENSNMLRRVIFLQIYLNIVKLIIISSFIGIIHCSSF